MEREATQYMHDLLAKMQADEHGDWEWWEEDVVLEMAKHAMQLATLLGLDEPGNENGWEDTVKHMRKIGEWDDAEVACGDLYRECLDKFYKRSKPSDVSENDLPENVALSKITDILTGMDGMTNSMAFGILECVKMNIYRMDCESHGEDQ